MTIIEDIFKKWLEKNKAAYWVKLKTPGTSIRNAKGEEIAFIIVPPEKNIIFLNSVSSIPQSIEENITSEMFYKNIVSQERYKK